MLAVTRVDMSVQCAKPAVFRASGDFFAVPPVASQERSDLSRAWVKATHEAAPAMQNAWIEDADTRLDTSA